MLRVELAPEVAEDFDRIREHLLSHDSGNTGVRIREIIEAVSVLAHNPLIGRPSRRDCRELIIGRRSLGYVVLYRFVESVDTVFVLAIRGQREAGYPAVFD